MTDSLGNVRLQRAYEDPAPGGGYRVLVDRVWPRGRTREQLRIHAWARSLGPSAQLRKWFGHDPAGWQEFQKRYRAELADRERAQELDDLAQRARDGPVTLVLGARDTENNQARVIADELERRLAADQADVIPTATRAARRNTPDTPGQGTGATRPPRPG